MHRTSTANPISRRLATVISALMLALMLTVALPGQANAASSTKNGCTQVGGWKTDLVCVHAKGPFTGFWLDHGLYIESVRANYIAPIGHFCNTKLYITFFDTNNRAYDQRISGLQSGCAYSREYTQTYNKTMRAGRVCGALSINGVLKPGACVSLYR